jgi:hypothetical protein
MTKRIKSSSKPAQMNPTIGETSRVRPTPAACPQSTPLVAVPVPEFINWLAMPTPMMEPTMVCVLEEGRPRYHVPRFQMMAAVRSAKTMEKPAPELT